MKKDDIKTLVVVILVCIIPLAIVLILNIKSNSDKLAHVNEYNNFFSVTNYINKYINNTSSENPSDIIGLLDKTYMLDNNIDYNNIFEKIDVYPIGSSISINNMEYVEVKENYIYYVVGEVYQNNFDGRIDIGEFKCIIQIDFKTLSFSVYPLKKEKYKNIIDKIKNINIENNNYNKISNSDGITKEQICALYLFDYLDKINNNLDTSYSLLSDKMKKQKEFSTLDSYKNYINNNINKMSTSADKCFMEKIKDNRVYSVIDKNENKFVFNEESIMNYKVDIYLK